MCGNPSLPTVGTCVCVAVELSFHERGQEGGRVLQAGLGVGPEPHLYSGDGGVGGTSEAECVCAQGRTLSCFKTLSITELLVLILIL